MVSSRESSADGREWRKKTNIVQVRRTIERTCEQRWDWLGAWNGVEETNHSYYIVFHFLFEPRPSCLCVPTYVLVDVSHTCPLLRSLAASIQCVFILFFIFSSFVRPDLVLLFFTFDGDAHSPECASLSRLERSTKRDAAIGHWLPKKTGSISVHTK